MSIYFIQGNTDGPIKIGMSTQPAHRFRDIQNMSPVPVRLLGIMDGGAEDERHLHRVFASHRLHGEWFSPAPDLLAFLEKHLRAHQVFERPKQIRIWRPLPQNPRNPRSIALLKEIRRFLDAALMAPATFEKLCNGGQVGMIRKIEKGREMGDDVIERAEETLIDGWRKLAVFASKIDMETLPAPTRSSAPPPTS